MPSLPDMACTSSVVNPQPGDPSSMPVAVWQGTYRELMRLQRAVARHCECVSPMLGLPAQNCTAHAMLADQSALNHLLYVYRMRSTFIRKEFAARR